jgi:hypothetical protein
MLASRARKASNEPARDRIAGCHHNNWNGTSGVLRSYDPWRRPSDDHVHLKAHKLSGQTCEAFDFTFSVSSINGEVLFPHIPALV